MPDSTQDAVDLAGVVAVTQADREAAAAQAEWLTGAQEGWENMSVWFSADFPKACREGVWDNHPWVQAFARHRLAATPAEPDEVTSEMIEAGYEVWNNSEADPRDDMRAIYLAMRAARPAASRSGGA